MGISKAKLRQALKALELIEQYKQSDYGDQFENEKYSIFEEIVRSPDLREWIGWDDDEYKAKNKVNLERLFGWISEIEVGEEDDSESAKMLEPIIVKSAEIRELKTILSEEHALEMMEKSRSLSKGLLASNKREQMNLQDAVNSAKEAINILLAHKESIDIDLKKI